ncbi:hypothetical protein J5N97_015036 [Dioscorea zingiberensis]|uniref:PRA1 family protein n=1 Tax=Dioscorea zingiberensis TaxID=325984 RepID=A0A9D5HKM3_9LILI|nr:hypothetical protein J5N97_015036 [Dioscorea zingiberensis]
MDWGNVTADDLMDALREVDWSSPPRPVSEFFSRFTVPRSYSKWTSRIKCNLYYYRTNYFILIILILGIAFLRRPLAIVSALLTGLSILFLNDSFAVTFNEKVTRTVRQFSPHLAAKLRPPITPVLRGRPSTKRTIHICGQPRWVFVLALSGASCFLWFTSCRLLAVLWALLIGIFATLVHATVTMLCRYNLKQYGSVQVVRNERAGWHSSVAGTADCSSSGICFLDVDVSHSWCCVFFT